MRRGQATIFIILGLVILIVAIGAVAVHYDLLRFKPPESVVISEVPTELKPLSSSIEQCQQALAEDAATRLMTSGGYVEPERFGVVALPPPHGTAASIVEGVPVAYWHHVQGGLARSKQPPLEGESPRSAASQIAAYVDERLEACVPWEDFPQYAIERGEPQTTITFGEADLTVSTAWPIDITTDLGLTELRGFRALADVPIKSLYEAADEVVEQLRKQRLPEHLTIEWLALYSRAIDDLPPLYEGMTFTRDIRFYSLREAEPSMRMTLGRAADTIEVVGSREHTVYVSDAEALTNLYLDAQLRIGADVADVAAHAYVPDTDLFWQVNENPAIAYPEVYSLPIVGGLLPSIVDENYYYDLTYPLILTFTRDGYTLNAAYETNIWKNQILEFDEEQPVESADYCSSQGGARLTLRVEPDVPASAVMTCGQETCPIGNVENGRLQTRLPTCVSGSLEIHSEDRASAIIPISSDADGHIQEAVTLHAPQETRLQLYKREVFDQGDGDYVLSETRVPVDGTAIFIRHGQPHFAEADNQETLTLIPGRYDVFVIDVPELEEPVQIPEKIDECDAASIMQCRAAAAGAPNATAGQEAMTTCMQENECVYLPPQNFTQLPRLYLDLSAERSVEIGRIGETLALDVPALDLDDLETWDDIGMLGALFDLSDALEPESALRSE